MARRSSSRTRSAASSAPNARDAGSPAREGAATALVVVLVLASQWLVDPAAADAFDSVKRAVVRLCAVALLLLAGPEVLGAALLARASRATAATATPRRARLVTGVVALALCWALVSALASPHRAVALDGWRGLLLTGTIAAIGASRILDGRGATIALGAFWVASAITAIASLLETAGGLAFFAIRELGGRARGFAFIGNEGFVALVMALAATSALAVLVGRETQPRWRSRHAPAALLVLSLAALAGTGNLTGWLALAAGASVVLAVRQRRLLGWMALGAGIAFGVSAATVTPLRQRVAHIASTVERGDWTEALTYRPIAWRAALEGARERPLLGQGPGTFETSFVPLRLTAEARLHRRLTKPELSAHFGTAHDEYLDAACSLGVPGALALVAAFALVAASLVPIVRRGNATAAQTTHEDSDADAALLCLAVLASAAVASLTWFPLQRVSSSVPILLVAGRALRLTSGKPVPLAPAPSRAARTIGLVVCTALVALVLPELPRHRAERSLAALEARVAMLAAAGARPPSAAFVHAAEEGAHDVDRWLPGDTRGLAAAGAAALFARDGATALRLYGEAITLSERAELVLDVGRAYALLDRRTEALAAFVRAVWLSPRLASELPQAARPLVATEIERRERALTAGDSGAIPPAAPLATP